MPVLALGPQPLANAFLRSPDEFRSEASYPLDLHFCAVCSLVQLVDVIDPELLFRDYIYVTGTSDTMRAHNAAYARSLVASLGLGRDDLVVEIASNDGSLLRCFKQHGVRTLGVEPAANLVVMARAGGIESVERFFTADAARELRGERGPARAVVANNVLAHVDDTLDFLRGCRELLADDGLLVFEVPYLRDLLDRLEYDTVYHEHLCYFSVTALRRLCETAGLAIARVEQVPVHGGSLRVWAGSDRTYPAHADDVQALVEAERAGGLGDVARFERFAGEVARSREALRGLIEELHRGGRTVAGYGAPAKGNTLLNYCGIDRRLLPFTVDKNPLKVGTYTPGTHIPVRPVSALLERRPEYVLILAWNFADEIMQQQREYRAGGGRFIIPLPEPRVVA